MVIIIYLGENRSPLVDPGFVGSSETRPSRSALRASTRSSKSVHLRTSEAICSHNLLANKRVSRTGALSLHGGVNPIYRAPCTPRLLSHSLLSDFICTRAQRSCDRVAFIQMFR